MTLIRTALVCGLLALFAAAFATAAAAEPYYEVDTLNTGLGQPPGKVDRSTPRGTMESLIAAERSGDWASAAHLLDLSDIEPAEQADAGAQLAQMLKIVLDRKAVISWDQLLDRPDALDVNETSRAATAGAPRRSLLIWELALDDAPASIRMNRVKPADGEAVWVFARQTVPNIEPLFAEYGPSRLESAIPTTLTKDAFWGLMWWEIIGLPMLLGMAALIGLAVYRVIDWLQERTERNLTSAILRAASTPAIIAAVTTVLWYGTRTFFVFSGRIDAVLTPLVAIGFVTALLMLIVNTVEAALDRVIGFEDIDLTARQAAEQREKATKIAALRRLLVLVVFLIGAGIVFSSAGVFQSFGFSLLASAGALTLVLGFAARKVLGNIMASLQIALNQSARIGDRVMFKGYLCHVERINFTYVQLRDWDGTRLVVPVEEFTSETFENWTMKDPAMLRILKFKLDPGADIQALREAFLEIVENLDDEMTGNRDDASVKVAGQDVFGIDVWFALPCADPNTSWDLACEARELLVARAVEIEESSGNRIFPEATPAEAA